VYTQQTVLRSSHELIKVNAHHASNGLVLNEYVSTLIKCGIRSHINGLKYISVMIWTMHIFWMSCTVQDRNLLPDVYTRHQVLDWMPIQKGDTTTSAQLFWSLSHRHTFLSYCEQLPNTKWIQIYHRRGLMGRQLRPSQLPRFTVKIYQWYNNNNNNNNNNNLIICHDTYENAKTMFFGLYNKVDVCKQ